MPKQKPSSELTAEQLAMIAAISDMIIPASEDGMKPSAADVDVVGHVLGTESHRVAALSGELERLTDAAAEKFGTPFTDLSRADQEAMVADIRSDAPQFLAAFAIDVAAAYYMDDRVMAAIGMEARPPFPKGYEVIAGGLSLLDPVRARGKIWRDAPKT